MDKTETRADPGPSRPVHVSEEPAAKGKPQELASKARPTSPVNDSSRVPAAEEDKNKPSRSSKEPAAKPMVTPKAEDPKEPAARPKDVPKAHDAKDAADDGDSKPQGPATAKAVPQPEDPEEAADDPEPTSKSSSRKLAIPQKHPRLWWSKARLARARAWYSRANFRPRREDALGNALVYAVTRQPEYARVAIQALLKFQIREERLRQISVDEYRWNDWVPVVFDWCYNAMTASERKTVMDRYTHYVDVISKKPWGGRGMEGNNYFWGYLRNELNWALATYYESPKARGFLDNVLQTRWQKWFLPYAAKDGKGGVTPEGSQYGRYMLQYPVIPFATARLMGRDLYRETDYYREALYNLIYTTTPAPTLRKGTGRAYYQVFPFGDDETDGGYPTAASLYNGDFVATLADGWRDAPSAQYARAWLALVRPPRSPFVAAIERSGKGRDFRKLPLDYFAPGPQYLYSRNRWGPRATCVMFQLGHTSHASHEHMDWGTFQMWRNGEWLTKESTGYAQQFAGGDCRQMISHNGILFHKRGLANAYHDGFPRLLRLESNPNYAYAAVDLSRAYRAHRSGRKERDDNPYAGRVIREFLFIKPLESLVILDRLESMGEKMPAREVDKTFLLHFPQRPKLDGSDRVLAVNHAQALRVITLLPGTTDREIVDESKFQGRHLDASYYQYRLEESQKGHKQSYFLHVLQGRDIRGADIEAKLHEDNNSWVIHLDHPSLGHAVVVFNKGMSSRGGKFAFSAREDAPKPAALLDKIQGIKVTDEGPVWEKVRAKP